MASRTASKRQAKAAAQQQAAKEKRQILMAVGLGVVLLAVLAIELPGLLKASSSSSSSTAAPPVAPVQVPSSTPSASATRAALRRALRQPPRDVFSAKIGSGAASTLGTVGTPPGLHDPFATSLSKDAAVAPVTTTPSRAPTLPGTIVLGRPGAGKVQVLGWIVVLASIPTAAGQDSANAFAATATKAGVSKVAVLNSSNSKPLRGGYWVVYSGPFTSLAGVSAGADDVHKLGFTSAYIRQLIVYKKKAAPPKKKPKANAKTTSTKTTTTK